MPSWLVWGFLKYIYVYSVYVYTYLLKKKKKHTGNKCQPPRLQLETS